MFRENFSQRDEIIENERVTTVIKGEELSLPDTFECGQCFRYEELFAEGERRYMTVVEDEIIFVGQRRRGEIIFYGADSEKFDRIYRNYFDLDTDYSLIRDDILKRCDSDFLRRAAMSAGGIVILRQKPWETLCSFIISQNNNIPRIRRIVREISAEYGVNLALQKNLRSCPIDAEGAPPCEEKCKKCGRCYTFPSPEDILSRPEGLLPSRPGFRYKYILDAADKVARGEVDLKKIEEASSYEITVTELMKILGVGLKVASCTALFGFHNLDAFPIDVWMRRAIDEHFGGRLDHEALGEYRGIAQQYIFHYIRNLIGEDGGS